MSNLTFEQVQTLQKALHELSAEYYKGALQIMGMMGHGELNYLRTPIHLPNGSSYILALLHTSGPVLDLRTLAEDTDITVQKPTVTSKE